MAITLADFNKIWASTSPLTPYSFSEANYKQGWNFIGSTPPARQMWDYLQKQNDEKMQYLANNYLPLSGGIMTGQLVINKVNGLSADNAGIKMIGDAQNFALSVSNKTITKGIAPSGEKQFGIDFYGVDTDSYNKRIGMLEVSLSTTNQCTTAIRAYDCTTNTNTSVCTISCNVDGSGNPYTYAPTPANGDNSTKIATTAFVHSNYLPLSGGTMTGTIVSSNNDTISHSTNDQFIGLNGGIDRNSARLILSGKSRVGFEGTSEIIVNDGTNIKKLLCKPNGTLTWDGQPIQTSSDRRLKQDFSSVPDDVLEAWGKVEWQQFKYKADVERKGDSCRFHTGLVAQDVKEVGEKNHVDLLKYGILCHDVREAVEEEKDENGNVIREASEAVDLWTVRYEEALAMEVIYLRNEIKKLREEISKLK